MLEVLLSSDGTVYCGIYPSDGNIPSSLGHIKLQRKSAFFAKDMGSPSGHLTFQHLNAATDYDV